MRVEPFTIGSYIHVLKRGARGLPIVHENSEKWRFLKILFYMNDKNIPQDWERDIKNLPFLSRPSFWPDKKPLVKILCYTLMPNHFHLLLKEVKDGGVTAFMQKIGNSMTGYHNLKYKEKGSIFQGSYKSRTVNDDSYFRYLAVYIMVKNVFELYPKGIEVALKDFDKTWEWATKYSFSSLPDYAEQRNSPIIDKEILGEIFNNPSEFKSFAKDVVLGRKWDNLEETNLLLDNL